MKCSELGRVSILHRRKPFILHKEISVDVITTSHVYTCTYINKPHLPNAHTCVAKVHDQRGGQTVAENYHNRGT